MKKYMADPPAGRSSPEYHAYVAIRELPSLKIVALAHPDEAEGVVKELNDKKEMAV